MLRSISFYVFGGGAVSSAGYSAMAGGTTNWEKLKKWGPIFVIAPSILASFIYVFVFSGWTLYISLSDSTLLPSYGFKGLGSNREGRAPPIGITAQLGVSQSVKQQ